VVERPTGRADGPCRGTIPKPDTGIVIKELLVPLDGTEESLRALPAAARLAQELGAAVSVLMVTEPQIDALVDELWLEAHLASSGVDVRRTVLAPAADVTTTILEVADEAPGTVVCMSSHGWHALRTALRGSVSAEVVRRSTRPVIVVGPEAVA
jgi:nucleotide-binding universal stress UspA family protein